jgi:hypothetical protein
MLLHDHVHVKAAAAKPVSVLTLNRSPMSIAAKTDDKLSLVFSFSGNGHACEAW